MEYILHRTKKIINLHFVHLNLCTALALGLVLFIAGIEGASNNKVHVVPQVANNCVVYIGCLQVCGSTLAVFVHICFLLDVV